MAVHLTTMQQSQIHIWPSPVYNKLCQSLDGLPHGMAQYYGLA
jgi:hypothetical protein